MSLFLSLFYINITNLDEKLKLKLIKLVAIESYARSISMRHKILDRIDVKSANLNSPEKMKTWNK
jgi:hypothetical protein